MTSHILPVISAACFDSMYLSPPVVNTANYIIRVQTPEAQGPHLTTPVQTLAFPRAYRALWVLIGNNLDWTLVGTGMSHSVTITP